MANTVGERLARLEENSAHIREKVDGIDRKLSAHLGLESKRRSSVATLRWMVGFALAWVAALTSYVLGK
jgi:hypothetical protein